MVDAADDRQTPVPPLVRRIPVQLSAFLVLVVCVCAFVAIYLDVSPVARGILGVVAAGLFAVAMGCLRMYLEVDDEGVAVRYLLRERWATWPQIERVEIASGIKGSESIRVVLKGGDLIDVPPALLQPTAPTSRPRALARLRGTLAEIEARRPDAFRSPG
ncbi:PH domain-containing protein [Kineosporia sp. J2-2]|uniref:PH domain-containing protein n=1 Tax=Kineosporia corallincola TaxID=2835133 RepID=A0ABS5TSS3_9ACTN|nr:PH domain-containing protein [Kineosporia corallincola]MBT0773850.1 PH domain-containing protein [Kineosporia corallincola]